ncbi:4-hydroxythreonine-4-phosphate dehydrogenase PdxA [Dokdonella immobilis]|uniref:4-hydroxythreonine-4-phosphate dehydrogenase n=1 Tax=Dokdonella immobilis TaxID=578942 RepID=A0A1I4WUB2_9GAMM|nr:4-hydroxythreonine-4-phosphate dehydrogenase PdxA [Dokdonella immobilis]SFN16942.1 4-hydroxythreonine-4-phosphate dehydrogenase [Dokdonella immobilis]
MPPVTPADPTRPRIALTAGEPAGIGPELIARLAGEDLGADLAVIADARLMAERAEAIGVTLELEEFRLDARPPPGRLGIIDIALAEPSHPGSLDPRNARYVLETLAQAADGAASGTFDAIVTAPVHKGVINDAGVPFSGHTEFFADRAGCRVVMMLVARDLRVALATTHLPLAAVPAAITRDGLSTTLRILNTDLRRRFGLAAPRIAVLGLNPHAGEGGHLGREEIETIEPVLEVLRKEGLDLVGPLPADTAFVPSQLTGFDAVLAMYHDQGLPVLKHAGFGHAVNVTLGLPYIRTSVDHGTALDLAGSGRADAGSLRAALQLAIELAARPR